VLGGVALVHAEQVGREQRRLLAAGAGADLQDGVLLVGRSPWAAACASPACSSSGSRFLSAAASSSAIAFMSGSAASASVSFSSRSALRSSLTASTSGPRSAYSFDAATNFCESRLPPDRRRLQLGVPRHDLVEFLEKGHRLGLKRFAQLVQRDLVLLAAVEVLHLGDALGRARRRPG
jgi:hypothetical protein